MCENLDDTAISTFGLSDLPTLSLVSAILLGNTRQRVLIPDVRKEYTQKNIIKYYVMITPIILKILKKLK